MPFHCRLAFCVFTFAGAAALLLLGPALARAADQEVGKPTAYHCDYQPGGLCTCDGGHNTDDCQKLKESGLCKNPNDGSVVMCCSGGTCSCTIGGQEGTDCPTGSEPAAVRPGAVEGGPGYIELEEVPREGAPPVRTETKPGATPTKPGYIWVDDHWERPRAK